VWCFCGDGEMDEPESMGAIGMADARASTTSSSSSTAISSASTGRCAANGKIIQELESDFRGSGWNVIKVVWGRHWDRCSRADKKGVLMRRMMECVDGEYQTFKSKDARTCARALLQTRRS